MRKFLEDLIARKKAELANLKKRSDESSDLNEVRSIGKQIDTIVEDIRSAEAQLAALPADEPAPAHDTTPDARSLNPLASYGQNGAPATPANGEARDADPRGTMEYRTAFMNYYKTGAKSDVLIYKRDSDDQNERGDLGVLMPTTVIQSIMKETEKVYGLLYSKVKKTNIKGGVKYPIGAFSAVFHRIGENGAPTARQNGGVVDEYVEFSYKLGEIRLAQTLLASVMSVPVFEQELAKVIVEAYVKAMDVEILTGGDSTLYPTEYQQQMTGILTEANKGSSGRIPTDHIIEFTEEEMADWKSWQTKLFAKIPLSMRKLRPEFVMTANTYEANIKTLHDDNNRPLWGETYNPVDGDERATFKGRLVEFIEEGIGIENFDDATDGEYFGMYWVPEQGYAINTNLEFAVKRYFDEEKLQWVDRAVVINDGKVLDPKYIWLLKKGE
ncbi:MAG: phage major capsid protein [Bacteroidaceae bacterium]|nr:phage major capsid protein [Bacteroidaceae bacterium]